LVVRGRYWRSITMSGAKGRSKKFEPLQITGIDTRVWQKAGSANDIKGALFTLRGEVIKSHGIKPIYDANAGGTVSWPGLKLGPSFPGPTPFEGKIYAMGVFRHHGAVDILVQHNDPGGAFSYVAVIRGGTADNIFDTLNGLSPATGPSDSYRFVQSGDILILTNGKDPNYKWDGVKFSPLGISSLPPAPEVPTKTPAEISVPVGGTVPWFDSSQEGPPYIENNGLGYWQSYAMKVDRTAVEGNTYEYRMTWVNDKGQESEPGPASNRLSDEAWGTILSVGLAPHQAPVSDTFNDYGDKDAYYTIRVNNLSADAPSMDIAARNLYRSTDKGLTWLFHSRLPGNNTDNLWDYARVGQLSQEFKLPEPGVNKPPPMAKWAFPFRTRTYYGGLYGEAATLAYSQDQGGKEAVGTNNYIEISNRGADELTGFAIAQDYALIFKRRSLYMLTHDKEELPILTPISRGVGAVSDRAIISFEGTTYWLSEMGFYSYDGAKVAPISRELTERVKDLPPAHLKDAFSWVDVEERRVFFSICGGPDDSNREIWAIHVDSAAFSILDGYEVGAAIQYDKYTYVAFYDQHNDLHDIGLWGVQSEIGGLHSVVPALAANPIDGRFETSWLTIDSPNSDKTFYRLDLFYTQTTTNPINISWAIDWDERVTGATAVSLAANDATIWGGPGPNNPSWDDPAVTWDTARVRSVRVNLSETTDRGLSGKCIRFLISDDDVANSTETPWRIVGFLLYYADLGVRSEGTDVETE